jgi:hypothetical protein
MRALFVIAMLAATAHADAPSRDRVGGPYSRPIIVADALAVVLVAGGYGLAVRSADCDCEDFGSMYLMGFGIAAYFMPIAVHHDEGNPGRGWLSGAARAALPIGAGLVANGLTDRSSVIVGSVLAGVGAAMALDWIVLARPPGRARARVGITGTALERGATLGFAGIW